MAAERRPAAQFPRPTITELATALGVHRNSCSAWLGEGAPAGPPYCELAWRTWAAGRHELDLTKAPPEQGLLELLATAGIPIYRRFLEQQRGAAPALAAGDGKTTDVKTATPLDWTQENKRLDAEQKRLDLDKQRRRLIDREELIRLVEGIAEVGASVFKDAPGLVDVLPLAPDDRQRVRAAVIEQLAQRRARMVDGIQAKLTEFLTEKLHD